MNTALLAANLIVVMKLVILSFTNSIKQLCLGKYFSKTTF